MSAALTAALTENALRDLAGDRSFERGLRYATSGAVESLVLRGDSLTARVTGTETYKVRLSAGPDDALEHDCTCPVGRDCECCKHCVAAGLAWLAAKSGTAGSPATTAPKSRRAKSQPAPDIVTLDDLRPWILAQPASSLADLLLETAERDDRLREKLLRLAALATAKSIDLSVYRKTIDRATRTGGFIDYHAASDYAAGVGEAIEPLKELLADEPSQASSVIELVEHALSRVCKALGEADDSDGAIGSVLSELQTLHLEACTVARPDPETLATNLFKWEMNSDWDVFYNAAETYAGLLGPAGLDVYRRQADAVWKKLPALTPRQEKSYDNIRFRVTAIMEALARAAGDLEALVAIKAKDLSHAYDFLAIAQLYHEANQPDEALAWAERGLAAFPQDTDIRLLIFIADEYHRRQRHDDALALVWRPFESRPSLEGYQLLKEHADRADAWPAWRDRALAHLKKRAANETMRVSKQPHAWSSVHDQSTLIRVHLWENDSEAAWNEASKQPALHGGLWLQLAAVREKTHPLDAIPIYMREAQSLIARTGRPAYETAIIHLKKVKALLIRLGQPDVWSAQLASLRVQHKAKRTFLLLLAEL